jgi:hypothetical protein
MPTPTPDQITMTQVNTELGRTGLATNFNLANTRNLANITTSGSKIQAANLSFGLDLPKAATGSNYGTNNILVLSYMNSVTGKASNGTVRILFNTDGSGAYQSLGTDAGTITNRNITWKPSLSTAGDHWIQVKVDSAIVGGAPGAGSGCFGNAANTDTRLNAQGLFQVTVLRATVGIGDLTVSGNVILKYSTDGGATKEEYFRRPYVIFAGAERFV